MLTEESIKGAMKTVCVSVDIDGIPVDGKFREYGLDSLDVFNLLIEMQDLTGREVSDVDVPKLDSIATVLAYFKAE